MEIVLRVDGIPPGMNGRKGLIRAHWAALSRMRDDWYARVSVAVNQALAGLDELDLPIRSCTISYTVCSNRAMDWDNAGSTAKFVLDGLVACGFLLDDSPSVIHSMQLFQRRCPRREAHIEVTVHLKE